MGMKPEVLLKAFVLHKSEDAFVELVASTLDEVYSHSLHIVKGPPHLVEETVLRVYWELARKSRTLGENVVLGTWLREHTCKAAVKVLHEADRSVDRAALNKEKRGLSAADTVQTAPLGLATRVSQSILLNNARGKGLWLFLPRIAWPAWIRPVHVCSGAACVLVTIVLWNIPFHRRNQVVMAPDLPMTPASYGQLANPDPGDAAGVSQTPNTNHKSN